MALMEKDYWKWDENSWNFWRKSTAICPKMKDHQDLKNDFHRTGKIKKPAYKFMRIWTKNQENFERFQENFEIFLLKISMENWLFSQFFTKYFLDFWLLSESIYLCKITPVFYNIFSVSGGVATFPLWLRPCENWTYFKRISQFFRKSI